MKIAIAATSQQTDSRVSTQGARTPFYFLFDTEHGGLDVVQNPAAEEERGAGPRAAEFLVGKGINKVVAAGFGRKFIDVLERNDIIYAEKSGTVSEIISELHGQA